MVALLLAAAVAQLSFSDLFEAAGPLRPSRRAEDLSGKRVRIEGFMARMEIPPSGAFWLCKAPLELDEGGGGSGDLPVESILVVLTPPQEGPVAPIRGPLRVEGRFETGRKVSPDGTVSLFRIVLDPSRQSRTHKEKR
jgi:hypothetical protein